DKLAVELAKALKPGDHALIMSYGGLGRLHGKPLSQLVARFPHSLDRFTERPADPGTTSAARTGSAELPLCPLNSVLFPGGPLPLRIFEPRYVDMVGTCLREQRGFGVVLIREGSEVGAAEFETLGTLARIVDFHMLSDGLLGLTTIGERRFR